MTIPFWFNDPQILINNKYILELWCDENMTQNQKLNAITRLVICLSIIGYFITQKVNFLISGLITLVVLIYIQRTNISRLPKLTRNDITEGFTNINLYNTLKSEFTSPTSANPLMNVMLPEINENPLRNAAAPAFNSIVEGNINDNVKKQVAALHPDIPNLDDKLFKDLGDNFNFEQSMRPFYATANTKVPNDQSAFAEYCYGDMPSCKDGSSLACVQDNPRWIMR